MPASPAGVRRKPLRRKGQEDMDLERFTLAWPTVVVQASRLPEPEGRRDACTTQPCAPSECEPL